MKESQAIVQRQRLLGGGYYQLELAITDVLTGIKPGQCVLARPKTMRRQRVWHPYMRDVWYPSRISRKLMTVELANGGHFEQTEVIDLVGPVGKPYEYRNALRNVMLLAYNTPPLPLLMPIPALVANSVSVTLVLLGSATAYPTSHLPPEVEVIRGDDHANPLSWQNQVTTIGWADQVFAVVPPSDETAYFAQLWDVFKQRRAELGKNYLFGVFQAVTPCGVGACDACLVRTKQGAKHACVDGPALDLALLFGSR